MLLKARAFVGVFMLVKFLFLQCVYERERKGELVNES